MKGWIKLHIQVHNAESSKLEDLGIDITDDDVDYEEHHVQVSQLASILEREEYTVLTLGGEFCYCIETADEIFKLIEQS